MRRLLTALLGAMLLAGLLPLPVLADAAVAHGQSVDVIEDVAKPILLAAIGGDGPLTFSVVDGPHHGTLAGATPNLTYTPAANYYGPDSFTFKVNDTAVDSNTAIVSITVDAVNDAPVANDDPGTACGTFGGAYPTAEDYLVVEPATSTCALGVNDADVDGDRLSFELLTQPVHGTATVESDGGWSYAPAPDFNMADSFTYRVSDGAAWSAPATVRLWVVSVNDAPTFTPGGDVTVDEDSGSYDAVWALSISAGPGEIEAGQTVDFVIEDVSNPSLFATPLSISSTGVLSFEPDANWYGSSTVRVHLRDDGGIEDWGVPGVTAADTSANQTFTITVAPVNDAPTPSPTSAILDEDVVAWLIPVSAHDMDGDDTTAFVVATQALHGLVEPTSQVGCDPFGDCTGAFLYTAAGDYSGPDSFTFTATDGAATSAPATISITVAAVNDAPVANNQSLGVTEDTAAAVTLDGTDVDLDELAYTVTGTGPTHGTLSGTVPNLTYAPNLNYNGADSFTFTASDGSATSASATSASATVSITVSAVNDTPVCTGSYTSSGAEDAAQDGTLVCTDIDSPSLTYAAGAINVEHGARSVSANGAWTYAPNLDYSGPDSFTFTASDDSATSATATVSITVSAVNDKPVCNPLALGTDKNVPVAGTVTCTDVDSVGLTLRVETEPGKGTVAPFNAATGAFTYTPQAGASGPDSFTVIASDGAADSLPVTVDITIGNHAPVAEALAVTTNEDTIKAITLHGSDADPSDVLTFAVVTGPAHGTLGGTAPLLTYTPAGDYNGPDSFTFKVNDGLLDSAVVAVAITVTPVNDVPVATAQSVTTTEDTAKALTVSGNDVEGGMLDYTIVGGPGHGTLSGTAPLLIYTPNANYYGVDSFTFRVNDGTTDSTTATVSISVPAVNDAPVARTDGFTVNATTTTMLAVLTNDYSGPPVNGVTSEPVDAITVTWVGTATRGRVSIASGGTAVIYDPTGCSTGGDSFTYTIVDGGGLTATATAFVTIARPGTNGLSSNPVTDTPTLGFITGSTIGATIPARLRWCGVTRSGSTVRSYGVAESRNAGATYAGIRRPSATAISNTRNLARGTAYRWRVRTGDSAGRTGSWRYTAVSRVTRYQESSTALTYAGTWGTKRSTSLSGGAQRWTKTAGATATITLTNVRQFAIVGPRSSGRGSFEVYVDGVLVKTVSEKATTTAYRRVLYVRSLTAGAGVKHTIQVRAVGNGQVDLDAILTLTGY